MRKNKGISLVALVITIVVTLILTTVGIVVLDKNVEQSTIVGFMNDLKDVEDSFGATLVDKGKNNFETYTKAEVLDLVNEDNLSEFENELTLNNDATETEFYKINLKDIGILKSSKGEKVNGNDDIYVVTKNSIHAYYLKGIKVDNIIYFSISSKSSNI